MPQQESDGSRRLGISEIAEEIPCERHVVSNWKRRGKLPPPAEKLKAGPLWRYDQVAEFIKEQRAKKAAKGVAKKIAKTQE